MAVKSKYKTTCGVLEDRVEEVIERGSLEKKLLSGKKLVIKLGADPSVPDLHLGHAVALRKLKEFQELGHRAVFVIGDFTAMIGDPSGKKEARPPLSRAEAQKNASTYIKQAEKILGPRAVEVRYNSEWFSKMRLSEFIPLAAKFSLRRIMDREDFKKRLSEGREVSLHEALYQVLQAYDSVAVSADVELGGIDQKLNILAGRELQRKMGLQAQDAVILPLLIGLDGTQKMSKSLKNYIGLSDSADNMFGKVMSVADPLIVHYAELAAFLSPADLGEVRTLLKKSPMEAKKIVARRVVELYWGRNVAREALAAFEARHGRGAASDRAYEEKRLAPTVKTLLDAVLALGGATSRSEARRLVLGGAVEVDGTVRNRVQEVVDFSKPHRFRIGKKKFVKTSP